MDIKKNIKILLVDNDESVRMRLRVLLENVPEFEVIDEAEDGKTALELTQQLLPDIVIVDAASPVTGGLELTKKITSASPVTKVIAFISSPDQIKAVIDSGASGILLKASDDKDIISTVRSVSKKIEFHRQTDAQSCRFSSG